MDADIRSKLFPKPISLATANAFVKRLHRHNSPTQGCKFAVGCVDESGNLRGVAIAGRPIARHLDDGETLEITRTCTDGCPNANSFLYGRIRRIAVAMGYRKVMTYTQSVESGASLRGAGFSLVKELAPRKNWKDSSKKFVHLRNSIPTGGVSRARWERTAYELIGEKP